MLGLNFQIGDLEISFCVSENVSGAYGKKNLRISRKFSAKKISVIFSVRGVCCVGAVTLSAPRTVYPL
jgi:hypothetical protein